MKCKHLFLRGWIRECSIEVYVDNQSKIVIVKLLWHFQPGLIFSSTVLTSMDAALWELIALPRNVRLS